MAVDEAPAPMMAPASASKSELELPEDVQAVLNDYMDALKAYRQRQRELGPTVMHAVRSLAGLTNSAPGAKEAAYAQASQASGAPPAVLADMVSLRKRLLHDLPAMRQQVSNAMAAQQRGNVLHVTHIKAFNANMDPQAPLAPASVSQWARAKQYKERGAKQHSSGTSTSTNSQTPALSAAVTEANSASLPISRHPPANGVVGAISTPDQAIAPGSSQQQGLADQLRVQAAVANGLSAALPAAPISIASSLNLDSETDASGSATGQPYQLPQVLQQRAAEQAAAASTTPSKAVSSTAVAAPSRAAAAGSGQEAPASTPEAPAKNRLRSALQNALAYKMGKGKEHSEPTEEAAQPPPGVTPAAADAAPAVERARFDVYKAPRNSRADDDLASTLVCP
uniref:Uncharacterized protein n=1 Tax=Chlamydomonas leiostraca TaxID=1034604 RepID=A0A7S0RQQ9_9CHLO